MSFKRIVQLHKSVENLKSMVLDMSSMLEGEVIKILPYKVGQTVELPESYITENPLYKTGDAVKITEIRSKLHDEGDKYEVGYSVYGNFVRDGEVDTYVGCWPQLSNKIEIDLEGGSL